MKILKINEYWNLNGGEHFWKQLLRKFFQANGFWRMLKNHKHFHFTRPLPEKTNYLIFLKRSENLFSDPFWLYFSKMSFFWKLGLQKNYFRIISDVFWAFLPKWIFFAIKLGRDFWAPMDFMLNHVDSESMLKEWQSQFFRKIWPKMLISFVW